MDKKYQRVTIYMGDPMKRLFSGYAGNKAARINQVVDRYLEICNLHGFSIDQDEVSLIRDLFKGQKVITADELRNIDQVIANSEFSGSISAESLLDKLGNATYADFIAEMDRIGL